MLLTTNGNDAVAVKRDLTIYQEAAETLKLRDMFPEKDAVLFEEVLEFYWQGRTGSKRYVVESVKNEIATIMRLTTFLMKPFWKWDERDLDIWFYDLARVREVAHSTQKTYYHHLKSFFEFLIDRKYAFEVIRQRTGCTIRNLCTDLNSIVHRIPKMHKTPHPPFTHDEIVILFDSLDEAILDAMENHKKDFRALMRDKAICALLYYCGLRISEALTATMDAFHPNPNYPEFGNFGEIWVWGKGSKGSGPKYAPVPIIDIELPRIMEWYINQVRPLYLDKAGLGNRYLFLSERGNKLGKSCFEERFATHVTRAGLAEKNFTPHSMRRTSVSHEYHRLSSEAIRIKHRHVYGSTTQDYMSIPDSFIQQEFNKAIAMQLDGIEDKK